MKTTPYAVGDVVLTEDDDEVTIVKVMMQDEGPAYWVRFNDTGMRTVLFHEELVEV